MDDPVTHPCLSQAHTHSSDNLAVFITMNEYRWVKLIRTLKNTRCLEHDAKLVYTHVSALSAASIFRADEEAIH